MKRFIVRVEQFVEVILDETKFTPEFMAEFRQSFFPFEDLEEHAEHIGQLQARGVYDMEVGNDFVEGYGPRKDLGISAVVIDTDTSLENPDDYVVSDRGEARA